MTNVFVDQYLPMSVQGLPCNVGPRFSTRIVMSKSGDEARNRNWAEPLRKFMLPEAAADPARIDDVLTFWQIVGGPYAVWPFRDPTEFASCPLDYLNAIPAYTGSDQSLGVGDGFTSAFQLSRARTLGPYTFNRTIVLPVLDTIEILMGGVAPGAVSSGMGGPYTYTITRPGGIVTFDHPVHASLAMTWGGLFDTLVRFEADDTLDLIVHSEETGGASPLTMVEERNC